ncbi:radical SAM protein, partial [Candidatus Parcubacteria bacterium]|nr:radical SAM protein [Candidatus Parcubacteria bacterium]
IKNAVLSLTELKTETSGIDSAMQQKNALEELSAYAIKNWQLVNVSWELTYLCNQRCKWCYLENFQQKGLSENSIINLSKELKQVGALFLLLTGGEIFLRPDTLDIIEYLENEGFVLEIKTNGTSFGVNEIERMSKINFFDIQVSIYETKNGYSDLTKSNYQLNLIEENVKLMLERDLPVTLSVLVGKHNIDEIEKIHEKLSKIGAEIFYSPYITPNRGGVGQEILFRLSKKELEEKFKPFLEKINGFPVQKKYRDCDKDTSVCFAGRDQIAIDPNGIVYPCLDLRIPLGNLFQNSLSEILKTRKSILNQFTLNEIPQCKNCDDRNYCDSCVGLAIIENGDYRIPLEIFTGVFLFWNLKFNWIPVPIGTGMTGELLLPFPFHNFLRDIGWHFSVMIKFHCRSSATLGN